MKFTFKNTNLAFTLLESVAGYFISTSLFKVPNKLQLS